MEQYRASVSPALIAGSPAPYVPVLTARYHTLRQHTRLRLVRLARSLPAQCRRGRIEPLLTL